VVGSKPPAEILALAAEDVVIVGFVDDLNSFLNKMRVSVAPLRYGAGIKGKIGTAMAVGLPVVATSIATEGMMVTDGENILVRDDAVDFAEAVIRLYGDESLWSSISESSIKFADSTWGAEAAWKILATILAEMGVETKRDDRQLKLYSTKG
jgi:glycosyltransferase involved in cell wall biosynthesis